MICQLLELSIDFTTHSTPRLYYYYAFVPIPSSLSLPPLSSFYRFPRRLFVSQFPSLSLSISPLCTEIEPNPTPFRMIASDTILSEYEPSRSRRMTRASEKKGIRVESFCEIVGYP